MLKNISIFIVILSLLINAGCGTFHKESFVSGMPQDEISVIKINQGAGTFILNWRSSIQRVDGRHIPSSSEVEVRPGRHCVEFHVSYKGGDYAIVPGSGWQGTIYMSFNTLPGQTYVFNHSMPLRHKNVEAGILNETTGVIVSFDKERWSDCTSPSKWPKEIRDE